MDQMVGGIVVVVPVKTLATAKSRLAPRLAPAERHTLVEDLLGHVLTVAQQFVAPEQCVVISPEPRIRDRAAALGATALAERGFDPLRGQNAALEQAREAIRARKPDALLVISGDLPLLSAADLEMLVALGRTDYTAVLAPDRRAAGTNALFVRPVDALPFCFGPDSYRAHRREAEARGLRVQTYEGRGTAFDVDCPEDLDALEALSTWREGSPERIPIAARVFLT